GGVFESTITGEYFPSLLARYWIDL
ncbi:GNAT family N-acetyltransferase, partial [Vibrio metoecus]